MPAHESTLLTTGQAAKLCSVTADTVLKWIKKGRLSGVRTAGGHYRIERRDLEPLAVSPFWGESSSLEVREYSPQSLRCWDYMSDQGVVRDECQRCVVYRVGAARCFLMAGVEPEVGHARRFCQSSCENCVFYRRVNGLASNVLFITSDDALIDRLVAEGDESVALRFARSAYEASALISDFRPAFVVVDLECIPAADAELMGLLAADPRVPGLKVIFVVPAEMRGRKRRRLKNDLVIAVLEKPFGASQIAAVINGSPVGSRTWEDGVLSDAAGAQQR